MDIYMEHTTGLDAAHALRKTDKACQIVFTTYSTEHAAAGQNARLL